MSYLRKPTPESALLAATEKPDGGAIQENYPALWEYLSVAVWDDGTPRQRATLLLMYEDGLIKACLSDRALERVLWVASDDVLDLLSGMERQLADGTAQWRKKPPYNPGKRK